MYLGITIESRKLPVFGNKPVVLKNDVMFLSFSATRFVRAA